MSQVLPKDVPQTLRRWKRYSAYKDLGVEWLGEIPEHWEATKLGAKCSVKARLGWKGLKASEYVENGYIFLSTPNIKEKNIDFENVNYITAERYLESPEIMLEVDDVLIAKDGSTLGIVNVVRRLPAPTTVNSSIAVIRHKQSFDSVFLYYFLASDYTQNVIQRMKGGMGVPHLFQTDLRKFMVLTPPIPEQQAIASFLEHETVKIDALIAKKERLIELLQEKRTAIISHAVTKGLDPSVPLKDSCVDWLGKVAMHWRVIQLRRCWKVIDCKHRTAEYFDEGIPIVSTTEVKPGRLNLENTRLTSEAEFLDLTEGRLPKLGDIIYSRNASVGSAAYVDTEQPFCMGQDVCLITSTNQNQLFLSYLLNSPIVLGQLEALMVGSTINRINVGQIQRFWVLCPPSDEQAAIASYLDRETTKIDALIAKIREGIEKLKEYRTALISAAVTGKIDVRNEVAS
jgi:type I restriction enzyme S subunit